MTTAEAAALLGTSPRTLLHLTQTGTITPEVLGRGGRGGHSSLYRRSDVEALRERREQGPPEHVAAGTCACGCGTPVLTRGHRFAQGHQAKLAANVQARKPRSAPQPPEERTCRPCGKTFQRPATRRTLYCSPRCRGLADMSLPSPKTALGYFLLDEWGPGEGLSAFARRLGMATTVLRYLLDGDRLPSDRTLARLRVVFGDRLPATESATDRRREHARRLHLAPVPPWVLAHRPEALAKNAAARRGRKVPRHVVERRLQTIKTSRAWLDSVDRNRERLRATTTRATRGLVMRLKNTPTPDRSTRNAWATEVADRLELSTDTVRKLWRPILIKYHVVNPGGRPIRNQRCEIAAEEWRLGPPKQGQHGPNAYWHRVARRVSLAEDLDPPLTRQDMQKWASKHPVHPGCPLPGAKADSALP